MTNEMMNRRNDMFDAMNDWFGFPRNFFDANEVANIMQSDVAENDKQYQVKIDMPGMNKENINLNYHDGRLNVSGARKSFKDLNDKDSNVIHEERSYGRISRSYQLPNVDVGNIHAKYEDGVLTVTLPKLAAGDRGNSISID